MTGLITLGETMGLLAPSEIGPLHHAGAFRLGVAGAESNVAIGVRRLGAPATWIGHVGHDEVGDLVLRELRAEQVEVLAVRDPAPTGLMLKTRRTADVGRVTYYRTGSAGSKLSPADLDEAAILSAGVLHVTGITAALGPGPLAAVHGAVEIARAAGVPVSLDVNYRAALWSPAAAAQTLRPLARAADLVFAGEQEAALLTEASDPTDPAAQADAIAALGPRQVIIKLGAQGCAARIDDAAHTRAAIPMRVVDTVGAGDAFVAGYLAGLLRGDDPATRLSTAIACGAFAVTVSGDWEGLPTRAELDLLNAADPVLR